MAERIPSSGGKQWRTDEWFPHLENLPLEERDDQGRLVYPQKGVENEIRQWKALYWLRRRLFGLEEKPGGVGTVFEEIIFNLGAGGVDIAVGTSLAPPRVVTAPNGGVMAEWVVMAGLPSVGSNLVLSITRNGFAYETLTYPAGSTALLSVISLSNTPVAYHDYFNVDILAVGSACRRVFVAGRYTLVSP